MPGLPCPPSASSLPGRRGWRPWRTGTRRSPSGSASPWRRAGSDFRRRCRRQRLRKSDPWGTHLIFDAADGALVGFGGFKGAPVDGRVEIGYAIAQERRNRGLAGAAVLLMVERARSAGVHVVVAHTLSEPNASTAVLTRCGFTRVATVEDPDDGVQVWRWELDLRR